MVKGSGLVDVPGINAAVESKVMLVSERAYAHTYRRAWASIMSFVVLAPKGADDGKGGG
jgi:hypothetical protein